MSAHDGEGSYSSFAFVRDREEGLPRSETHRTARCILYMDRDLQPRACTRAISVTCRVVLRKHRAVVRISHIGVFSFMSLYSLGSRDTDRQISHRKLRVVESEHDFQVPNSFNTLEVSTFFIP